MNDVIIKTLNCNTEHDYAQFLQSIETSLIYYSHKYQEFIQKISPDSQSLCLLAYEKDVLKGALPISVKKGEHGTVVNSSPFYGSHGWGAFAEDASNEVKVALLKQYQSLCIEAQAKVSTLISSPFSDDKALLEAQLETKPMDERVGQVTYLPESTSSRDELMALFHQKTRNMARKGAKSGFDIQLNNELEAWDVLYDIHVENMQAIGGQAKSRAVFSALADTFEAGTEYQIYLAKKDGQVAAALLLLFYNNTVEYFTPVVKSEFRGDQPLSLLIFESMYAALQKGFKYWNWGGTWLTQEGVYRFKSRWGATDLPYHYFVLEHSQVGSMRALTPEQLLSSYPYFYTLPFSLLEVNNA